MDRGPPRGPQSNQRGIETDPHGRLVPLRDMRLNRTSVGLKRIPPVLRRPAGAPPQSNQRGIETRRPASGQACRAPGLNRTSVGLKPRSGSHRGPGSSAPQSNQRGIETGEDGLVAVAGHRPQSNQRGIETVDQIPRWGRQVVGLNRTSVGLKHPVQDGLQDPPQPPQSNQRGIERHNRIWVGSGAVSASIEPAWD